MTWATDRLDALIAGDAEPPPVVATLRLGLVDAWRGDGDLVAKASGQQFVTPFPAQSP